MSSFRLRKVLEEKGMTQTELARLSGVSQVRISEISSGKASAVSLALLDKIAAALNVSVYDLIDAKPRRHK
jgi:putative transcriptional regulator